MLMMKVKHSHPLNHSIPSNMRAGAKPIVQPSTDGLFKEWKKL
jgi:hypothetical protein